MRRSKAAALFTVSSFLGNDFFYNIVLDGALKDAGMASFKAALSRDDVTAIRDYIIPRERRQNRQRDTGIESVSQGRHFTEETI